MNPHDLTDADRIDLMEQCYSSVEEVCSQLSDDDWDRPTDLEGWSVKDNLSHLLSYETIINGGARAPENIDISSATWVKNDFQAFNEREVEWRRATPAKELLEEYREVTAARAKRLREMDDAAWSTDMPTPFGPMPARDMIGIRMMDFFYHDQDIRRAVGRGGGLDGDVARVAFHRLSTMAMPRVVVKGSGAPDGTTVAFDITPERWAFAIAVDAGRGALVARPPAPTVRLVCDLATFFCLCGGRWTPERVNEEGRVTIEGDVALGEKIVDAMTVIP